MMILILVLSSNKTTVGLIADFKNSVIDGRIPRVLLPEKHIKLLSKLLSESEYNRHFIETQSRRWLKLILMVESLSRLNTETMKSPKTISIAT